VAEWLGRPALDSGPRGREFDSRRVTTRGNLFTPMCLYRRTWSSVWSRRFVTFRLLFGSFASNLEHVANLLCAQVNSSLLHAAGREMSSSVQATGRSASVTDWCGGMYASCKPALRYH